MVNGTTYSAKEINARIENAEDLTNQAIYQFEVQEKIPTVEELKVSVNKMLKPMLADYKLETENGEETKGQFLQDLFNDFVLSYPMERNWEPKVHLRYKEVVDKYHAYASKRNVRLMEMNKQALIGFKQWFSDPRSITGLIRIIP